MSASRKKCVTQGHPDAIFETRKVLHHCQNVAHTAAQFSCESVLTRQDGVNSRAPNVKYQITPATVAALAASLKTRVKEYLGSKCIALNVQITRTDGTKNDQIVSSSPSLVIDEVAFQFDIPNHFRGMSKEETAVLVDAVYNPHTTSKRGTTGFDIFISITVARRSIASVFCTAFDEKHGFVAIVDSGVQNIHYEKQQSTASADKKITVMLSSSFEERCNIEGILKCIGPCVTSQGSDFVQQSLAVARGEVHLCILIRSERCAIQAAMEAIISASGGKVTDLFGNKLLYNGCESVSGHGFFASSKSFGEARGKNAHLQVCHAWRKAMVFDNLLHDSGLIIGERPQATDIALDTAGNIMTAAWLSEVLGKKVSQYEARESSAVRYLMSNACRLSLHFSDGEEKTNRVFVKRVAMDELEHVRYKMQTAPHKLLRDVRSYQVEAGFLNTSECKRFGTDRARIVRAHYIESNAATENVPAIFSRFLFVLEDFGEREGWYQSGLLNYDESIAAIDALASFHAFFWNGREMDGYENVKRSVWSQATYWLPSRQASDCFEKLAQYWKEHRQRFGEVFDDVAAASKVIDAENFGEMLERYAMGSAEIVHGYGLHEEHGERTLIHGDAKAANLFFRKRRPNCGEDGDVNLEVGMIDFQWCGWGHAGVDVAYVLACAVSAEVLGDEGREAKILEEYHTRLVKYFVLFGKARDEGEGARLMAFEKLKRVYEEALVDLTRVVVGYHWVRIGASVEVLRRRASQMGSNSYNKSVECARWLIGRCARVLADKRMDEEGCGGLAAVKRDAADARGRRRMLGEERRGDGR